MKSHRLPLLAVLGLSAVSLRADDPAPTHVLTLDASGHPRADLNLTSTHVTGTLDAARLPAGVGGTLLPGVNRPTGTDATALDHVPVTALAVGEVRQVVFTSGLAAFEAGGIDAVSGYPFTSVAATYRLVATPGDLSGDRATSAPDTIPTPTEGKVWRLVSAALSNGDVLLPNGTLLGFGSALNLGQGAGGIDLSHEGGSIDLSHGGGSIVTGAGAGIYLGPSGFIQTGESGYIVTGHNGYINTTAGGSIITSGGSINVAANVTTVGAGQIYTSTNGDILTGDFGYIHTGLYGCIATGDYSAINTVDGGYIDTHNGGSIDTSNGGGSVTTSGGGFITTDVNGYVATGPNGFVDTTGGSCLLLGGTGSPEGVVSAQVGSLYTDRTKADSVHVLYVKQSGSGPTGWVGK